jgi:hypothetical protein
VPGSQGLVQLEEAEQVMQAIVSGGQGPQEQGQGDNEARQRRQDRDPQAGAQAATGER